MSLRDIAEQAGVSISAVSLALNPRTASRVSVQTRNRIEEAAQAIGYRPNRAALALKTGRYQTIGIWAGKLGHPVSGLIISAIQEKVEQVGFEVVIRGGEHFNSLNLPQWPVDGVLTLSGGRQVEEFLRQNPGLHPPIVNLGEFHSNLCDSVSVDLRIGVTEAVTHLYKTGRRRIAMLMAEPNYTWNDPRRDAYRTAVKSLGLEPLFILSEFDSRSNALETVQGWLQKGVSIDALMCMDDAMAFGALRALREAGKRVPQDIALVGCDGLEETEYQAPPITTILQPFQEICEVGWQFLQNRMRDPSLPFQSAVLEARLAVRASSFS